MAGRFLLRRSGTGRAQARCNVEISDEQVARLVSLATSLADRMDAMPSAGLEQDLQRRTRVQLLRGMAAAGRRTLAARDDARPGGGNAQHSS